MTKPSPSRAKAQHQWKQIKPCACGNPAVRRTSNHDGICQRCYDIEQDMKQGTWRRQKYIARGHLGQCLMERPVVMEPVSVPSFAGGVM